MHPSIYTLDVWLITLGLHAVMDAAHFCTLRRVRRCVSVEMAWNQPSMNEINITLYDIYFWILSFFTDNCEMYTGACKKRLLYFPRGYSGIAVPGMCLGTLGKLNKIFFLKVV